MKLQRGSNKLKSVCNLFTLTDGYFSHPSWIGSFFSGSSCKVHSTSSTSSHESHPSPLTTNMLLIWNTFSFSICSFWFLYFRSAPQLWPLNRLCNLACRSRVSGSKVLQVIEGRYNHHNFFKVIPRGWRDKRVSWWV